MTTNFEDAVQAMTALKQEWGIKEWSELIKNSRSELIDSSRAVRASNIVISGEYLAVAGACVPVRVRCIDGCVAVISPPVISVAQGRYVWVRN